MPFVSVRHPAIGISLLKARLAQEGITSRVGYANIIFAEMAGMESYSTVDEKINLTLFPGDWLFAQTLFGNRLDTETYLATVQHNTDSKGDFKRLLAMKELIGPFLHQCMERLRIGEYGIIGFTTTFQQNMACLSLAHAIKHRYIDKIIVLGGANCEGSMGVQLHQSFPWIDYVCRGEADDTFPALIKCIDSREPVNHIPGLVYRKGNRTVVTQGTAGVSQMDTLPYPDYDDYFMALENSPLGKYITPSLPIQNARGCWWGAKSQCTFCGLNGENISFRSKSAPRVLQELQFLQKRHGISTFTAVDNVMDMRYFEELLPMLQKRSRDISLFYEVRSTLNREQVRELKQAGIHSVQPGIESLSTHVLQLMRKGVNALQNVAFLKWCSQYEVVPAWNLLYGFPGETEEDYQQISRFLDFLTHLTPPHATAPVRIDRFSPFYNNPDRFGIQDIRPYFTYNLIYPLKETQISNLAYFFQYEVGHKFDTAPYLTEILEKINTWKQGHSDSLTKVYKDRPDLLIVDTRTARRQEQIALNGIQREVYELCDSPTRLSHMLDLVKNRPGANAGLDLWLPQFLAQMEQWGLMIREDDRYLSLAIEESA